MNLQSLSLNCSLAQNESLDHSLALNQLSLQNLIRKKKQRMSITTKYTLTLQNNI